METEDTCTNTGAPIKMGTKRVGSWVDSYSDTIDCYTADGWRDGGEWYFIRLKSGHQLYGFDEEDNGSCCFNHFDWVSYDGWDITEAIPELVGDLFRASGSLSKI